jgi:tripartite-type tricarboxylate transporter receptor subunit TctC
VVPYAAGGPTDTIARIMAERLRVSLGQPVIVENTTGAGGTIAVARVARSPADGYTISIGQNGPHVVTGATYQKLPYDLLNNLQPLALLTEAPFFLAARKAFPADGPDRLDEGQSRPGLLRQRRQWQRREIDSDPTYARQTLGRAISKCDDFGV